MKNEDDLKALDIVLSEILRAENVTSGFMLGSRFARRFEFSDEVLKDKHVRALRALLKRSNNKDTERFSYEMIHGLTESLAVLPAIKNDGDLEALDIVLSEILRAENVTSGFMLGLRFAGGFEFTDEVLKDKHVRALRALLKHVNKNGAECFCHRLIHGLIEGLAVLPVKVKPE